MTIGLAGTKSGRLSRLLTRAPLLLSRHSWIWPLVAAAMLPVVGLWVRSRVEGSTRTELANRLQTLLNADLAALRLWFLERQLDARSFANDVSVQNAIAELRTVAAGGKATPEELHNSAAAQTLGVYLKRLLEPQGYLEYVVIAPDRRILASPRVTQVGRPAPPSYEYFLDRAFNGELAVSRPFARESPANARAGGPTMFVAAPVYSDPTNILAVLALRMRPEAEFSRIFSVARMGETGEAYAFDRRGVMLTASRFDSELKALGLIPARPEATTILNLRLLDPGRELGPESMPSPEFRQQAMIGQGRVPMPRFRGASAFHLTRMAESAVTGDNGVDVQGYRNYRGVRVVGAWAWLSEYQMGVATEVAVSEAFQMLYLLRQTFLVLFGLLVLSSGAIFAFTLLVDRLQASVRRSALAARRLGQYILVQEIGRGSHGMVYRARHTLLRRPVAIKLLSPELTNDSNVARFEQEAQMTSQLSHPNTVAVYDYGRTPEGLFYYAMEFLSGIDLDALVRKFGPQSEGRVIHILQQVCGSLDEAHRIGLIHRDIKPANIVLTRRGGQCDVVKVLDFGLVKGRQAASTDEAKDIVGTPHFMAPEAVENPEGVDARSDIYSLGAVGYWLLTGTTLFKSDKVEGVLNQQVKAAPEPVSKRLGEPISSDLEGLIMKCLAKEPGARPASASLVCQQLAKCRASVAWTPEEAEAWWNAHLAGLETASATAAMAEKTLVIAPR